MFKYKKYNLIYSKSKVFNILCKASDNKTLKVEVHILDFDKKDLKRNNNILHISVRKIYSDKVNKVNNTIIKNCKKGFINTNI